VTLQFPPFDQVTGVTATLVDAAARDSVSSVDAGAPGDELRQYGVSR